MADARLRVGRPAEQGGGHDPLHRVSGRRRGTRQRAGPLLARRPCVDGKRLELQHIHRQLDEPRRHRLRNVFHGGRHQESARRSAGHAKDAQRPIVFAAHQRRQHQRDADRTVETTTVESPSVHEHGSVRPPASAMLPLSTAPPIALETACVKSHDGIAACRNAAAWSGVRFGSPKCVMVTEPPVAIVPATVPEPPPPLIVNEPLNEPSPAGAPNETVPNVCGSVAEPLMLDAVIVVWKNTSYVPAAAPLESVMLLHPATSAAAITPTYRYRIPSSGSVQVTPVETDRRRGRHRPHPP